MPMRCSIFCVVVCLTSSTKVSSRDFVASVNLFNRTAVERNSIWLDSLPKLRGDLSENELIGYINRVKKAAPNIGVGYVDAYFEFSDHPRVTDACDVNLANCYPFWEGCPAEHALLFIVWRGVESESRR